MRRLVVTCDRCGVELSEDTELTDVGGELYDVCDTCLQTWRMIDIQLRTSQEQYEQKQEESNRKGLEKLEEERARLSEKWWANEPPPPDLTEEPG